MEYTYSYGIYIVVLPLAANALLILNIYGADADPSTPCVVPFNLLLEATNIINLEKND